MKAQSLIAPLLAPLLTLVVTISSLTAGATTVAALRDIESNNGYGANTSLFIANREVRPADYTSNEYWGNVYIFLSMFNGNRKCSIAMPDYLNSPRESVRIIQGYSYGLRFVRSCEGVIEDSDCFNLTLVSDMNVGLPALQIYCRSNRSMSLTELSANLNGIFTIRP